MAAFEFVADPAEFRDPRSLVLRIPQGIRSKRKLLAVFADKLQFPHYFGWNWDALYDCLTAVAGVDRPITVVHCDLPFGAKSELRKIYLSILRDVAQRTDLGPSLRAVFPARVETAVKDAVG